MLTYITINFQKDTIIRFYIKWIKSTVPGRFWQGFPLKIYPWDSCTSGETEKVFWPAGITVRKQGTTLKLRPNSWGAQQEPQSKKTLLFPWKAGGKGRSELNTMVQQKQQNGKSVYRLYLDSSGEKIKYYKPSIEVAPCCHAIQKHFKLCPCLLVNISERG